MKTSFPHYLIREVQMKDVDSLLELANTPGMFNFPSSPEAMKERIELSMRSFSTDDKVREKDVAKTKYVFVAEDLTNGKVVATSMIAGQHGTEIAPHHFFKVGNEKRYSPAIQTGFIHGTLTLKTVTNGPSELGALVVGLAYRNHPERVGRQIFFSRFLFLGMHPEKFKDQLLAELLPPLNKKGHSPLWEAIGRRFTNMDYWEADELSAQNKEFIYDLFPQGKIYTTFLPADARNSIGKLGKDTEPVAHLLKRIGFTYQNEIDPFDGGPHLRAKITEITPLKKMRKVKLKQMKPSKPARTKAKEGAMIPIAGLISHQHRKEGFMAINVSGVLHKDEFMVASEIDLARVRKFLKIGSTDSVMFLPYF